MSKYHATKNGLPLCGTRGNGNRFNVVCVPASDWNALSAEQRCSKCVAKILEMKGK